MEPTRSSEYDEKDREIIKLLEELGSFKSAYPPELLRARRAAFLAQLEQLTAAETEAEWSAEEQEIVRLLGTLKSAQVEYPPQLLAARRSAFLRQMEKARGISLLDQVRLSIQKLFSSQTTSPTVPSSGFMRTSLVIASLVAAALIGTLFLQGTEGSLAPSLSPVAAVPTQFLSTSTKEVVVHICTPDDETPSCPSGELDSSQDLADAGNGLAQPAVSSQPDPDGAHKAAYLNDGRDGASWVSNSPNSWIKIDLGTVTAVNTVSLQKGSVDSGSDDNPGRFVIEVALSDVYANGDSSNDSMEYTQVLHLEQTDFSGTASETNTIQIQFPPINARFVKVTFEKAEVAIKEVGVFMVQPPELAEQPTITPSVEVLGITHTPLVGMNTATPVTSVTWVPTDTAVLTPTATPTALSTNTLAPTVTSTAVLVYPVPSDTPMPPVIEPSPTIAEPIFVTGNDQTLTFICDGNAVEIRGHSNSITLLGSCSSITVIGNKNQVFWESGSPVITDKGKNNIILQL
jgi:Protein of unknown function (DUF3060)/F5/8 type C domain